MKENYRNLPWHCRQVISHSYPLTDIERLALAQKMADARAEAVRLEEELASVKKRYREEIDMYNGLFSRAALQYKSGLAEEVQIECDVYRDVENREMVFVPVGELSEITRKPMTPEDERPDLMDL